MVRGKIAATTRWWALVLLSAALAPSALHADENPGLERVTLQLKWHDSFQFAGYYAAKWKGYYRDEGLEVRFQTASDGSYAVSPVLRGEAEYGVMASGLLHARLQGLPVVVLATIFQHSGYIILVRADSGIVTPADLVGRSIMSQSPGTSMELRAMFLREGIPLEAITFVDGRAGVQGLVDGRIDGLAAYSINEPRRLRLAGVEPRAIRPIDYGVDFYGDCLFTSEDELKNHPERVAGFRRASLRGWEYAMSHVDEMAEIIAAMPDVAQRGLTVEHLQYQADKMHELIRPQLVEIGHMNPGRWRSIADTYVDLGMVEPGYSLEGFLYDPRPTPPGHGVFILLGSLGGILVVGLLAWLWTGQLRRAVKRKTHQLCESEEGLRKALTIGTRLRALLVDLNRCNRLEEMFSPLLDAAADLSGMEGVAIYVVEGDQVVLRCHRGLPEEFIEHVRRKSLVAPEIEAVVQKEHVSNLYEISASLREALSGQGLKHAYSVPLRAGGDLFGFLNVATDRVSDPTRTEIHALSLLALEAESVFNRLKAEEEHRRLTLAMEQTAEHIVITDVHGTILYVNPAFERVTGYSREEVIGRNPRILKSGVQDAAFYEAMWEQLRQGKTWMGRIVNKCKDGTLFTEEVTISPMRDGSGRIVSYVGVKRDMTHEIELEEQLRQSQKMEAVGQLAGGMAHDFNNLLQVILGYTSLILSEASPEDPLRGDVDQVHEAATRASKLTGQLLTFSRRQVMEQVRLDLNEVVEKLSGMLRGMVGANIDVQIVKDEALRLTKADRGQVEQILINICANARDAMPEGGCIRMETSNAVIEEPFAMVHSWARRGHYVLLKISDTGIGMDAETQQRMFDPFFTTKAVGKGTGMGLATVYGIVTQHQGLIHVQSVVGQGTEFQIYFPMVGETDLRVPEVKAEPKTVGGNETILVAEDEEAVRMLTVKVLRNAGYEVLEALDGAEALKLLETRGPSIDMALIDVVMPVLGGRAVYDVMARKYPHIEVLFVSGYSPGSLHANFVLDAGLELIKKPFSPNALLSRIRQRLETADRARADR